MSHEPHGQCLFCGSSNSYSSFTCRECNTQLPWANALTQMLAQSQAAATRASSNAPAVWSPPQPPAPQPLATSQPRFCAHCGSEHGGPARFCAGCGTAIVLPHATPQAGTPRLNFSWPLPVAAPTAAPIAAGHPAQGGFVFSPQQNVNVNVVTEQKSERKRAGRGRLSRMFGFLFTCCAGLAVFAFLDASAPAFAAFAFMAFLFGLLASLSR